MQAVLDLFIALSRDTGLAFGVFFGLSWILLKSGLLRPRELDPALVRRSLILACSGIFLTFLAIQAWYLTRNGFAGEVEPVVSSLSWQLHSGQPLYTTFDQAERYSVLYGPSVFLTNGLFLKILGPSLFSAKVASALAAIASLLLLYAALRRKTYDTLALVTTAVTVLYYWAQGFSIYLVRPDSLLVFAVSLGLYAAVRSGRWLAILTVAVATGFSVNLKIHCFVYFLPVLVLLARRFGPRAAVWSLVGAGLVTAAPFAFHPQISALNYLHWLTNEAHHGLRLDLLVQPVNFALLLALPLVVIALLRGRRLGYLGQERWLVWSLLPAVISALAISAKPGSGILHLMPLIPTTMFVAGRLVRPLRDSGLPIWGRPSAWASVAALALVALLTGGVAEYRSVRLVDWQLGQMPDLAADVQFIMDEHSDLTMGMAIAGEDRWFRSTWLKPLLVFQGNPVLLDPISVMDTAKAGVPLTQATYDAISSGRVAMWLVPRAHVPFQKMSWYDPDQPIFPADFVQNFQNCYTLREHSEYFDLWFWNGLPKGERKAGQALTTARTHASAQ
ncbi:hypothetical protein CO151_05075 [bacterium CG_4_9_14_3_um_filter_65_15]|nr:MAG: hypothetical protein CO151_05075 [bacterium CG_4_9_14_3_um_filter_65_15]